MNLSFLLRVMARRRRLRRQGGWTRERIERHQSRLTDMLRRHATEQSRFYRAHHAGLSGRPLDELPPVTKKMLMEAFDDVVTDPEVRLVDVERHLRERSGDDLFRGRYRVNTTSGTTGRRGIFLFGPEEWLSIIASYSRSYEWGGVVPNLLRRPRMAVVSTTADWHQSSQVGSSVRSRWVPTLRIDSTEPMPTIVARLNEWQPETLVGYASMLRALAEEQSRGELRISPKAAFSASEVLTGGMRQRMRDAWGIDPFNVYGATETATLASECGAHRLHLFEDLVITEVVDEKNRPLPAGEIGAKVLVTVLFSRTLPLIRYEMSDSLRLGSELCRCGRAYRLVDSIDGRSEDTLRLPGTSGETVDIHPNIFHDVLDLVETGGWQVVRFDDGLEVQLIDPMRTIDIEALTGTLRRSLDNAGVVSSPLIFRRVDVIPRSGFGKSPLVRVAPGPLPR